MTCRARATTARSARPPGVDANDPTWIKGFLFGSALRFDGNDFVRIPDSPALESDKLTVSAWVRGTGSPGTYRYIVGKGATGCDSSSYGLFTAYNGGLRFYVTDTTGAFRYLGPRRPGRDLERQVAPRRRHV